MAGDRQARPGRVVEKRKVAHVPGSLPTSAERVDWRKSTVAAHPAGPAPAAREVKTPPAPPAAAPPKKTWFQRLFSKDDE